YLSRLLHQRYASQFGWGFVLSGLVSLSLPAIAVIGVPVYLLLESGLALTDRLLMLAGFALCCLWTGWRLKHRLLNRVFTSEQLAQTQANAAVARAEAEEAEQALNQPPTTDTP
ncbi:MAG: hypothetical protein ACAI44_13275, partial [Candidatus Sericytochromatia bacterium]